MGAGRQRSPGEDKQRADAPEGGSSPGRSGRVWAIVGLVCGVLTVLQIIPILFGPLGLVFGVVGRGRGDRSLGTTAIIVSAAGLVLFAILIVLIILYPPPAN